jgi:hypothetical protein
MGRGLVMDAVAGPLFVKDDSTLYVFDSAEDLTVALEAVDVEDGLYRAYDKEGRRLKLTATGVRRRLRGIIVDQASARIAVERAEEHPTHGSELKLSIIEHLVGLGRDRGSLSVLELSTLAEMARTSALTHVGRSWLTRLGRR